MSPLEECTLHISWLSFQLFFFFQLEKKPNITDESHCAAISISQQSALWIPVIESELPYKTEVASPQPPIWAQEIPD